MENEAPSIKKVAGAACCQPHSSLEGKYSVHPNVGPHEGFMLRTTMNSIVSEVHVPEMFF